MRTVDKLRARWCRYCRWYGPTRKFGGRLYCCNTASRKHGWNMLFYDTCDKWELKA